MSELDADRIQEEAQGSPAMPEGAPAILEFHQLPRRDRAGVAAKVAALLPKVESFAPDGMADADVAVMIGKVAQGLDLMADVEDLLVEIAADPTQMRAWAKSADDLALLQVFGVFVAGMGEAVSSSS